MQKPVTGKIQKEGMRIWKNYCREDWTGTSNSEKEGKCAKNNRKAFSEPWKPKNESLKRERILLVPKKSNRPGRFCLEESVTDLIQGKYNCDEERKNLAIHHAKIRKKWSKIKYRSGMFVFERCRKKMGKVSESIHEVKRFYLFFWTMLSILESAWKFPSMNFCLLVNLLLYNFSVTLERTKSSKTAKSPSEHQNFSHSMAGYKAYSNCNFEKAAEL